MTTSSKAYHCVTGKREQLIAAANLCEAQAAQAVGEGGSVGLVAVRQHRQCHDRRLDALRRRHQQLTQPRNPQRHVRLTATCMYATPSKCSPCSDVDCLYEGYVGFCHFCQRVTPSYTAITKKRTQTPNGLPCNAQCQSYGVCPASCGLLLHGLNGHVKQHNEGTGRVYYLPYGRC